MDKIEETVPLLQKDISSAGWTFSINILHLKNLKWRLWFNLATLNLSNALSMGGLQLISSAQSSLNYQDGIGTMSIALSTIVAIVFCLVFKPVHQKLGSKRCLIIAFCCQLVFPLANLYPTWVPMLIGGLATGVSLSFLTITFRLLIAQIAYRYCGTQSQLEQIDRVQSRMFMTNIISCKLILALLFQLSSFLLGDNQSVATVTKSDNYTNVHCGAYYCNEGFGQSSSNWTLTEPSNDNSAIKLVSMSISCALLALVTLLLLVDSKESLGISDNCLEKSDVKGISLAIMLKPKMLLLTPLFIALMACDVFWNVDFTAAFITCQLGLEYVGAVLTWTGLSGAASSFIFGSFNSESFRKVPISFALLLQIAILIVLLLWRMTSNVYVILCLLSAGWYIGSGIKLNLVPALIAVVFPEDLQTAYAVQLLWGSAGAALASGMNNWVCMQVKIYFYMALLALSLLGYILLEHILAKEKRLKAMDTISDPL